ncbi:MAG: hypothetical protein C0480_23485 [Bradyrhizobium sp.]|nr:hypothetical protein [Bradyrhizobium sp.]
MPGLVPGIHVLLFYHEKDVDGRDKPGHDGENIEGTTRNETHLLARLAVRPQGAHRRDRDRPD